MWVYRRRNPSIKVRSNNADTPLKNQNIWFWAGGWHPCEHLQSALRSLDDESLHSILCEGNHQALHATERQQIKHIVSWESWSAAEWEWEWDPHTYKLHPVHWERPSNYQWNLFWEEWVGRMEEMACSSFVTSACSPSLSTQGVLIPHSESFWVLDTAGVEPLGFGLVGCLETQNSCRSWHDSMEQPQTHELGEDSQDLKN